MGYRERVTRSKGPSGPGLVWSSLIKLDQYKKNQNTATKQDNCNKRRRMQINAIARYRPNPKSEKSQALFSLA